VTVLEILTPHLIC